MDHSSPEAIKEAHRFGDLYESIMKLTELDDSEAHKQMVEIVNAYGAARVRWMLEIINEDVGNNV
jgi:heterodisulfide reductase subunit B